MKFRKEIIEGGIIPPVYGVAWFDYYRRIAVCYPLPFNLLIAALHWLHILMRDGNFGITSGKRKAESYAQGFADGRRSVQEEIKNRINSLKDAA